MDHRLINNLLFAAMMYMKKKSTELSHANSIRTPTCATWTTLVLVHL